MLWILAALLSAPTALPGVIGNWTTPNHSTVRIYKCDSGVCALLVTVSSAAKETTDAKNPDPAQRKRPLCGLIIGRGFQLPNPAHAEAGELYDPESGRTYRGEMTAHGDEMTLRGYIGIPLFGRSETWYRAKNVQQCSP